MNASTGCITRPSKRKEFVWGERFILKIKISNLLMPEKLLLLYLVWRHVLDMLVTSLFDLLTNETNSLSLEIHEKLLPCVLSSESRLLLIWSSTQTEG